MCDDCPEPDLDDLTRKQLAEQGGPTWGLLEALEAWASDHYGGPPFPFIGTLGGLLDELAARGYRVTTIDPGPSIEELLPAPVE